MSRQLLRKTMKLIDIGANLTDPVFHGLYRGKQSHPDDMPSILNRAHAAGITDMMVTGGSLSESKAAIDLCKQHPHLFATVGCHPTRTSEIERTGDPNTYFSQLRTLIDTNKDTVVAIGECGLDYDRLHFSDKPDQRKYFERQFELAQATGLPMFLHDRNTDGEFVEMIRANRDRFSGGVVHSYTGGMDEMRQLVDLGLYIGINGCSLKTEENLRVARAVPLDRLMIETDCPYCEIRPTHASYKYLAGGFSDGWVAPESKKKERWVEGCMVKSRNEPCMIRNVLKVLAALHSVDEEVLAEKVYTNTCEVFFKNHVLS